MPDGERAELVAYMKAQSAAAYAAEREQYAASVAAACERGRAADVFGDHKPGAPCPRCAASLISSRELDEAALCVACGFVAWAAIVDPTPSAAEAARMNADAEREGELVKQDLARAAKRARTRRFDERAMAGLDWVGDRTPRKRWDALAGARFGVHGERIEAARRVRDRRPDLWRAVERGELTIKAAHAQMRAEQRRAGVDYRFASRRAG